MHNPTSTTHWSTLKKIYSTMKKSNATPLLRLAQLLESKSTPPLKPLPAKAKPTDTSTSGISTGTSTQATDTNQTQVSTQQHVQLSSPDTTEPSKEEIRAGSMQRDEEDERQTPIVWFRSKL